MSSNFKNEIMSKTIYRTKTGEYGVLEGMSFGATNGKLDPMMRSLTLLDCLGIRSSDSVNVQIEDLEEVSHEDVEKWVRANS